MTETPTTIESPQLESPTLSPGATAIQNARAQLLAADRAVVEALAVISELWTPELDDEVQRSPLLDATAIERAYDNPKWLGFGYLIERQSEAVAPRRVHEADQVVIKIANEKRWSEAMLFCWLNSEQGRVFGKTAFVEHHQDSIEDVARATRVFEPFTPK